MAKEWFMEHKGNLSITNEETEQISVERQCGDDKSLMALADRLSVTIKVGYVMQGANSMGVQVYNPTKAGASRGVIRLFYNREHFNLLIADPEAPTPIHKNWSKLSKINELVHGHMAERLQKGKRHRLDDIEVNSVEPPPAQNQRAKRKKKLCSFRNLPKEIRQRKMLSWLVGVQDIESAMKDGLIIEEDKIECIPDRVSKSIIDSTVILADIQMFFTVDAWKQALGLIKEKEKCDHWNCNECRVIIK